MFYAIEIYNNICYNININCYKMRYFMNISLTPTLEKFVQDKVASGFYNSVSEVIREALRLLASKEGISQERFDQLNNDIEEGWNDTIILDGHSAMEKLTKKYE